MGLRCQVPARPTVELQAPALRRVEKQTQLHTTAHRHATAIGHIPLPPGHVQLVVHQGEGHRVAPGPDLPGQTRSAIDLRHQWCLGGRPTEGAGQAEAHFPGGGPQQPVARGQREDVHRCQSLQPGAVARLACQVQGKELDLRTALETLLRIHQLVVGRSPAQAPGRVSVASPHPEVEPPGVMSGFRWNRSRRQMNRQHRQAGALGQFQRTGPAQRVNPAVANRFRCSNCPRAPRVSASTKNSPGCCFESTHVDSADACVKHRTLYCG